MPDRQRHAAEPQHRLKHRELGEVARRLDGLRTLGLKSKLEELERRKAALEVALATAPALKPLLQRRAAAEPQTRIGTLEILQSLIARVVLARPRQGFKIELAGEVARMICVGTGCGESESRLLGGGGCVFGRKWLRGQDL